MKLIFRPLSFLSLFAISILIARCTGTDSPTSTKSEVFQGQDSGDSSVVLMARTLLFPFPAGSGVVIRDRCVLTSAHGVEDPTEISFEEKPMLGGYPRKYVRNFRTPKKHAFSLNDNDPNMAFYDLALVWMERKGCSIVDPNNHVHCSWATAPDAREWTPTWTASTPQTQVALAPAVGTTVTIKGYGERSTTSGSKQRKWGDMKVADHLIGPAAQTTVTSQGTYSHLSPIPSDPHGGCPGDSGGGAFKGNSLFGIISGGIEAGEPCEFANETFVTTFHNRNAEFVTLDADKYCRIKMQGNISSTTGGGSFQYTMTDPLGEYATINSTCANCPMVNAINVTITAVPSPGFVFGGWQSSPFCPCTSSTCSINANSITWQQEVAGIHCQANFNPGPPPCGTLAMACCPTGNPCSGPGLTCSTGTCQTCGQQANQPCCAGNTCSGPGLTCNVAQNKCTSATPPPPACGTLAMACCPTGTPCTGPGLTCSTGICQTCGQQANQPCCAGNTCSGPGLTCNVAQNKCLSSTPPPLGCGMMAMACCATGNPCNPGLTCSGGMCL